MAKDRNYPIYFYQLVDYVQGKLSAEEIRLLDARLLFDQEAWELLIYLDHLHEKGELETFFMANRQQFEKKIEKNTLSQLRALTIKPINSPFSKISRFAAIAASFLLLAASFSWIVFSTDSPDEIFAENFSAYPYFLPNTRSENSAKSPTGLTETIILYRNGKYKSVIHQLSQYDSLSEDLALVNLSAALANNDPSLVEKAIEKGKKWITSEEGISYFKWYEALYAIKNGQFTKADSLLITLQNHPNFRNKIPRLREKISNLI